MLICDKCHKAIEYQDFKLVIEIDTYVAPNELYKYKTIGHFHNECYNKLFIYRNEGESRTRCICGLVICFRRNKNYVKILTMHNKNSTEQFCGKSVYHRKCFYKFWMGKRC